MLELTRVIWSGQYERMDTLSDETPDGYHNYTDTIPLMFTTLPRLRRHGPHAAVRWRCGHGQWETLTDALANPRAWHHRDVAHRKHREEHLRNQQQQQPKWGDIPTPPVPAVPDVPKPADPCERCGLPVTGTLGILYEHAPPADGRHCPECRTDLARQPPGHLEPA
ncbi:hypothetical protein [Streptomyces sp. ALI-76-A]|uniref:hypothetical protein n=1 Tax=Streptomyces sp. ALI-76-A TaxID=3025736 RepID=UPI00256EC0D2|nr:hypothetical protein [Streptomyces sp. ALI-76-A]MDL5198709.1 hypothetical protein [Streptomyces sp. ALI-76-A]